MFCSIPEKEAVSGDLVALPLALRYLRPDDDLNQRLLDQGTLEAKQWAKCLERLAVGEDILVWVEVTHGAGADYSTDYKFGFTRATLPILPDEGDGRGARS